MHEIVRGVAQTAIQEQEGLQNKTMQIATTKYIADHDIIDTSLLKVSVNLLL